MTLGPQFHGTSANFLKEGDVIEPRDGEAFSTTDEKMAQKYASQGWKKAEQGTLFGSVYEVEPIGDVETSEVHPNQRISKQGFRVKRHVGFVPSDFDRPKWLS